MSPLLKRGHLRALQNALQKIDANRHVWPFKNILKKVKKKLVSLRHVALNGNLARQIGRLSRSKIFQKK